MRFRPPRRDDAPFLIVFIRVNHRNLQAVHQANRIDSTLAVVETVVHFLNRRPVEDSYGIIEGDSMPDEIAAVLLSVPTVKPKLYLHNVNIARTCHPFARPDCPQASAISTEVLGGLCVSRFLPAKLPVHSAIRPVLLLSNKISYVSTY